mmetsp:Transcript_541/g.1002  ORF Transcript_541/g.1002 Transcript_541/m.1002 type:complete len:114 (-) Transcript_541:328-669(-)
MGGKTQRIGRWLGRQMGRWLCTELKLPVSIKLWECVVYEIRCNRGRCSMCGECEDETRWLYLARWMNLAKLRDNSFREGHATKAWWECLSNYRKERTKKTDNMSFLGNIKHQR